MASPGTSRGGRRGRGRAVATRQSKRLRGLLPEQQPDLDAVTKAARQAKKAAHEKKAAESGDVTEPVTEDQPEGLSDVEVPDIAETTTREGGDEASEGGADVVEPPGTIDLRVESTSSEGSVVEVKPEPRPADAEENVPRTLKLEDVPVLEDEPMKSEPQELASRCRDAMNTQLTVMQRALKDALNAIKCAEEVQLASQKLAITLFKDGSELPATLHASTRLQDELATSLNRVVACSLGHATSRTRLAIETQEANLTPQKKRKAKASIPVTKETTTKKQKCLLSTAIKSTAETSGTTTEGAKSSNTLTKTLAACSNLTKELEKKKKAVVGVPGLKTLVQHFNTAQNNLDRNSSIDRIEALESLSVVADMAVGIMQHGKPQMKRHWVRKFRENISNIQEKFSDSATAFDGSISTLDKIISRFPLTIKEGQKLRVRLRGTLEEVKVWKDGQYTVADIHQNMSLVAEALESTCANWTPLTDKTIRDLTTYLRDRLGVFKRSKKREKRMQKLQTWLDKMELRSQEESNGKMALASNAKAKSKKTTQSNAKAQTPSVKAPSIKSSPLNKIPPGHPGRRNIVIELESYSSEGSDAESTLHESSVKSERATGSMHVL